MHPIIPKLSEKYNIHVLNMYQMSNKTPWVNNDDPRIGFYDMCDKYDNLDEYYGIRSNKGYGTKKHMEGIKEHGITKWHRKTFGICINYN